MVPANVIREAPVGARLLRSLFLFEALAPQQLKALAVNACLPIRGAEPMRGTTDATVASGIGTEAAGARCVTLWVT
jgi:hypothetical protein